MTANITTINLADGRVVTTSYGVPVAVFVPVGYEALIDSRALLTGHFGYLKTDRKYSVTSSRHANLYARQNGSEAKPIPHATFRALIAPIACAE